MASYNGRHAHLYDLFYADKPYEEEAAFLHECIQNYQSDATNTILELACGTGSHAFALEKYGYKITATDSSKDMLACARDKAQSRNSSVKFQLLDMQDSSLLSDTYDAAICLFDSIGYVRSNEALCKVFDGVHQRLRSGGLFIFEFWHAAAMLKNYSPLRVRRWSTPEGEVLRISETTLNLAMQLATVNYQVYELKKDNTYSNLQETQVNRFFLVQEMENWLDRCGFNSVKWYSGYTKDETINDLTWHIVAVASSK